MRVPAWQRRLAASSGQLRPIPAEPDIWGVFPKGDRRKRPLARISFDVVKAARAEGVIRPVSADAYELATDPEAASARRLGDFQVQHTISKRKNFISAEGHIQNREINIADSPLSRWTKRDPATGKAYLSVSEFEAGERLRDDYNGSVLAERITADWASYAAPSRSSGGRAREDASNSARDAKDRVFAALDAVGAGLDQILIEVCIREKGMEAAERQQGWPRRAGKAVLKIALQRLAIHYGMLRASDVRPESRPPPS
ncbi:DUF6456 domain-containing protein [Hyphobacterium sp.]|uniref:DUF6456 domain-containing protein n=1 Tax=Hyphobacterium sp. TaxID=2004662 RepID=UPI003BAA37A2